MGRTAKLVSLILTPALALTAGAQTPSSAGREQALREYSISPGQPIVGEADISPVNDAVAIYGWAWSENSHSDPNHYAITIPISNYRPPGSIAATLTVRVAIIFHGSWAPYRPMFIRYSPDGRSLLAYDREGFAHLFEVLHGRWQEVRAINLGLSADRPNFQPVDIEWSPDGKRVAVIFSFQVFHEGVVRVYDVATGNLLWERSFDLVEMGGEAWSPDGRRLAVTRLSGAPDTAYPERDVTNLLVLDANSGETMLAIRTGDRAGPVCFAPDNTVFTAPLHSFPEGHDRWHHEAVKVWDATTGRLIRRIASPGRDIHDDLGLSRDGEVLLGYVGKEKYGYVFRDMEVEAKVLDRRFQLFDYKTGNVIATSPDLTKGGACVNHMPSFRLGPHGHRVLVYWPNSGCPPSVFEVQ